MTFSLCSSCTNIGCEFQSGIVRTKCAFYMPPQSDYENRLKADMMATLDKIRAEIEEQVLENLSDGGDDWFTAEKVNDCLEIIDKYKKESKDADSN